MSERTNMDRIRDLVEGRLGDIEARRLREEEGPGLETLIDDYRMLDDMLEAALEHASSAKETPLPRPRARSRAWLAAAAILLASASGAGGMLAARGHAPRVVELRAIPLEAMATEDPSSALALSASALSTLASWRPVEGGQIRWLASLSDAREIARATQRPVLLFVYHPACPLCAALRQRSFTDRGVIDLVDGDCVPVNVDLRTASPELASAMTGWPYLAMLSPSGSTLSTFPGYRDGPELRRAIDDSIDRSSMAPALPWDRARALAEARIAQRARRLLLEARGQSGREGALAILKRAEDEFRGTPFAGDFARVRLALEDDREFPILAEAAPSRTM